MRGLDIAQTREMIIDNAMG